MDNSALNGDDNYGIHRREETVYTEIAPGFFSRMVTKIGRNKIKTGVGLVTICALGALGYRSYHHGGDGNDVKDAAALAMSFIPGL